MADLPTPPTAPGALLTEREAAAHLGVCVKSLYLWRQSGDLAYIRLGPACIRYDPADLERFKAERRQNGGGG